MILLSRKKLKLKAKILTQVLGVSMVMGISLMVSSMVISKDLMAKEIDRSLKASSEAMASDIDAYLNQIEGISNASTITLEETLDADKLKKGDLTYLTGEYKLLEPTVARWAELIPNCQNIYFTTNVDIVKPFTDLAMTKNSSGKFERLIAGYDIENFKANKNDYPWYFKSAE